MPDSVLSGGNSSGLVGATLDRCHHQIGQCPVYPKRSPGPARQHPAPKQPSPPSPTATPRGRWPRGDDHIKRPLAHHLVGDRDVPTVRVAGLRHTHLNESESTANGAQGSPGQESLQIRSVPRAGGVSSAVAGVMSSTTCVFVVSDVQLRISDQGTGSTAISSVGACPGLSRPVSLAHSLALAPRPPASGSDSTSPAPMVTAARALISEGKTRNPPEGRTLKQALPTRFCRPRALR